MASKTPKPLEIKQFYILLALSKEPMHGYALHRQALSDSDSALYFSFTSLYRILGQLVARGYVEGRGGEPQRYGLTPAGRRRLRVEAADWRRAGQLASQRID
jgi:DNA-binding PadR family transcriptional regulator